MSRKAQMIVGFLVVGFAIGCGGGGGGSSSDTTPPTITSVTPERGEINVTARMPITVVFSENVDDTSVNVSTFSVGDTGGEINGTVICNNNSATFTPTSPLPYSTTYTVSITTGVKDTSGNSLQNAYSWTFETSTPMLARMVSGSYYNSYALKEDNTVWAWGNNNWGALGDGTTDDKYIAIPVKGLGGVGNLEAVEAISSAHGYAVALMEDGTVTAWGLNGNGQLGDNRFGDDYSTTPRQVLSGGNGPPLDNIIKLSTGGSGEAHVLALKNDGTVWAWGSPHKGQLGDNNISSTVFGTPVKVINLTGVVDISSGFHHSLAVKNDGTVWAWGDAENGKIGNGTPYLIVVPPYHTGYSTPVQAIGLDNVMKVVAGGINSLALKNDGTVWGWGGLDAGSSFEKGTPCCSTVPVQVQGLSEIIEIATLIAGISTPTNYALKSDGTLWTWGGDCTAETSPGQIANISNVKSIGAGGSHVLFIKDDGSVWTFGDNEFGQLGDGTNTDSPTPVRVY